VIWYQYPLRRDERSEGLENTVRTYRSFLLFSLCAHILILAFTARWLVHHSARPRETLHVTLFQKAVPLPTGKPGGTPEAGKPPAPRAPQPEVREVPKPSPPKPRKKSAPRPQPPVARTRPAVEPPPPQAAIPPTAGIGLQTRENSHAPSKEDDLTGGTTRGSSAGGNSKGQGGGIGSSGSGWGGSGTLANPDYGVNPKPPYPLIARRMGAQGVVILRVFVRANGTVGDVSIRQSSGFSALDESALKTVRDQWRFLPARLDGQPVESWVEVPIRFVLADS
jgi:protein TonB